ncbi:MAG: hypothetical protein R2771_00155 [Saprospiraceae bacterium]
MTLCPGALDDACSIYGYASNRGEESWQGNSNEEIYGCGYAGENPLFTKTIHVVW